MCWTRARSLSELVDTATARRRQGEEDAARVELQFPFRPERDFATRCHSRRAALVATWNADVATGGLHGASTAEAQTRHLC